MRKMIPFAPWQTAYFLRWLRDMSQKGWELKAIKGFHAVFAPGTSGGQNYALFPPDATAQDLDELFLRLEDGSLTAPPELDRPMPNRLVLPEDPRLAQLVGKIGPYKYIQLGADKGHRTAVLAEGAGGWCRVGGGLLHYESSAGPCLFTESMG